MSHATVETIVNRVEVATKDSLIAIFKTESDIYFNAVFANTVVYKRIIEASDKNLIGIFDCSISSYDLREKLYSILHDIKQLN